MTRQRLSSVPSRAPVLWSYLWFEGGELSILHIEPFKSWSAWVWMLQARDSDLVILGPNAMNPEMPVPSRIIGRDKMSDLVFRLGETCRGLVKTGWMKAYILSEHLGFTCMGYPGQGHAHVNRDGFDFGAKRGSITALDEGEVLVAHHFDRQPGEVDLQCPIV